MLIFDETKFKIEHHRKEYEDYEKDPDYIDLVEYLLDNDTSDDELKKIKDSYVCEYSLIAIENMWLGNENNRVWVKKGASVLRGNYELFLSSKVKCEFHNSYVGDGLIINMSSFDLGHLVLKDSVIKTTSESPLAINIKRGFNVENSSIYLNNDEPPLICGDFLINAQQYRNVVIKDSNINIVQSIPYHYNDNYNSVYLINVSSGNIRNPQTDNDMGVLNFGFYSVIDMENVQLEPNAGVFLESCESANEEEREIGNYKISNTSFRDFALSIRANEVSINNVLLGTNKKELSLSSEVLRIDYDKAELKDQKDRPSVIFNDNSSSDGYLNAFFNFSELIIKVEEKSVININRDYLMDFTGDPSIELVLIGGKGTTTTFSTRCLETTESAYIINSKLKNMVVDVGVDYGEKTEEVNYLEVKNTTIKESELRTIRNNSIILENSKIDNSNITYDLDDCELSNTKFYIKNSDVHFRDNKFKKGSEIHIKNKSLSHCYILEADHCVYNEGSVTKIVSGHKDNSETILKYATFASENDIENIGEISDSFCYKSKIEDVDKIIKSKIVESELSRIVKVEDVQVEGKVLKFNDKTKSISGDSLENKMQKPSGEQCSYNHNKSVSLDVDF